MSRREVILHIAHSWGGGLARWIHELADGDDRRRHLVLEGVGTIHCYGLGLRLRERPSGRLLESWTLGQPIAERSSGHSEYREILTTCLREWGVDRMVISTLLGHSLDAMRTGLPTVLVYHDSSCFCPALFATRWREDSQAYAACRTCTPEELADCVSHHPGHRPLNSASFHLEARESFLEAVDRPEIDHVSPTGVVPSALRRFDPRFEQLAFRIVEHGTSLKRQDYFGGAEDGRALRVGLLGYLTWNKGRAFFRESFERLRLVADLHLIGAHDGGREFEGRRGVEVLPPYAHEELPSLLDRLRLDLALFLPQVPESFSYTLSEAWSHGLPAAATSLGAHAERIEPERTGFLFRDQGDLLDLLIRLDQDREALRRVARQVSRLHIRGIDEAREELFGGCTGPSAWSSTGATREELPGVSG